jgi:hypothetical protein
MINYKVLLKAISFMFLPTISILFVVFIGFFSITDFISFITAKSGWAIFLRVALVLAEIIFVCLMYKHYYKLDVIKNKDNYIKKGNVIKNTSSTYVERFFKSDTSNGYNFKSYATDNDNIVVIEKVLKFE